MLRNPHVKNLLPYFQTGVVNISYIYIIVEKVQTQIICTMWLIHQSSGSL